MTNKITDFSQLTFEQLFDIYKGIMHPHDLKLDTLWQVRQWDGMDGTWIDIGPACTPMDAMLRWLEKTESGTKKISFNEIDYYRIFPADTKMVWGDGHEMFRDGEPAPEPPPVVLAKTQKPRRQWEFNMAAQYVSALEKGLSAVGWHIAMAGTVLHKGESKHDLDVIVYPHQSLKEDNSAYGTTASSLFDAPRKVFEEYGMKLGVPVEKVHAKWHKDGGADTKHVEMWMWHHLRIDVFFLR